MWSHAGCDTHMDVLSMEPDVFLSSSSIHHPSEWEDNVSKLSVFWETQYQYIQRSVVHFLAQRFFVFCTNLNNLQGSVCVCVLRISLGRDDDGVECDRVCYDTLI